MQNKFFKFTVFLFVFTSINREFNPLHIDLRLFLFPLILLSLIHILPVRQSERVGKARVVVCCPEDGHVDLAAVLARERANKAVARLHRGAGLAADIPLLSMNRCV